MGLDPQDFRVLDPIYTRVSNGNFSDSSGDMHRQEYPDTQIFGYTDTQISGYTIESDLKMPGEDNDFIFNSKKLELETEETTKILKKRHKLLMKCSLINDNNNLISMMTALLDETAKNLFKRSSSLSLPLSTSSLPLKKCSSELFCTSLPLSSTSLPLSLPLSCTPVPVFLPFNPISQNEESHKPHLRRKVHKNLTKFLDMPRSPLESSSTATPLSLHIHDISADQNTSSTLSTILSNAFHALDTDGDGFLTASDFCTQGINIIYLL